MPEHPARPSRHGDDIERVEPPWIDGWRQLQFQDQLACRRPDARHSEASPLVEGARSRVVGRNQQPYPPASGHAPHSLQHRLQRCPTMAAALMALVERQPAQPPASGIPQLGVDDEETGKNAVDVDGNQGMRRATLHRSNDIAERPKEPLGLLVIQSKGVEGSKLGRLHPTEAKGRGAPGGEHGNLRSRKWERAKAADATSNGPPLIARPDTIRAGSFPHSSRMRPMADQIKVSYLARQDPKPAALSLPAVVGRAGDPTWAFTALHLALPIPED